MKHLLPLLLSLIWPACGAHGVGGLPPAQPIDFARLVRPATPNTALAAPAGFTPAPDIVTGFAADPAVLYATVRKVALAEPRTWLHAAFDGIRQIHFVVRSANANFPDLVTAQVTADGNLILWSRSVYGRSDFGVNKARVADWLARIQAALPP